MLHINIFDIAIYTYFVSLRIRERYNVFNSDVNGTFS